MNRLLADTLIHIFKFRSSFHHQVLVKLPTRDRSIISPGQLAGRYFSVTSQIKQTHSN